MNNRVSALAKECCCNTLTRRVCHQVGKRFCRRWIGSVLRGAAAFQGCQIWGQVDARTGGQWISASREKVTIVTWVNVAETWLHVAIWRPIIVNVTSGHLHLQAIRRNGVIYRGRGTPLAGRYLAESPQSTWRTQDSWPGMFRLFGDWNAGRVKCRCPTSARNLRNWYCESRTYGYTSSFQRSDRIAASACMCLPYRRVPVVCTANIAGIWPRRSMPPVSPR